MRIEGNRKYIIIILISIVGYIASSEQINRYRDANRFDRRIAYIPPVEFLKIASLDYKGIVSKLLLFRGMVYYGDRANNETKQDLKWIYHAMDAATTLDPYNIDAYYFSQAILPWEGNLVYEANSILERGMQYRKWDFYLPMFIGFNYFHFLHDPQMSAKYMEKAAKINPALTNLALNMHYISKQLDIAIAILQDLRGKVTNDAVRNNIDKRIDAYKKVQILEVATNRYKEKYGEPISTIEQLTKSGIIDAIPADPYGGSFFYNSKKDRIETTSKLLQVRK